MSENNTNDNISQIVNYNFLMLKENNTITQTISYRYLSYISLCPKTSPKKYRKTIEKIYNFKMSKL